MMHDVFGSLKKIKLYYVSASFVSYMETFRQYIIRLVLTWCHPLYGAGWAADNVIRRVNISRDFLNAQMLKYIKIERDLLWSQFRVLCGQRCRLSAENYTFKIKARVPYTDNMKTGYIKRFLAGNIRFIGMTLGSKFKRTHNFSNEKSEMLYFWHL